MLRAMGLPSRFVVCAALAFPAAGCASTPRGASVTTEDGSVAADTAAAPLEVTLPPVVEASATAATPPVVAPLDLRETPGTVRDPDAAGVSELRSEGPLDMSTLSALSGTASSPAASAGAPSPSTVRVGPSGRAAVGAPTAPGVDNAAVVVARMAPGFRRCYQRGLGTDPSTEGSVVLTATVGPNGEVTGVKASPTTLPSQIVACVSARVAAAQFAPPTKAPATVRIPLTLTKAP